MFFEKYDFIPTCFTTYISKYVKTCDVCIFMENYHFATVEWRNAAAELYVSGFLVSYLARLGIPYSVLPIIYLIR